MGIHKFWNDHLRTWSVDSLVGVAIPTVAKKFLTEVGLPTDVDWTLIFDFPSKEPVRLEGAPDLVVIGEDGSVPICLDEKAGGQVVCVEGLPAEIRFVNSSVELFGAFLFLYQKYRLAVREMDEEDVDELIDSTEALMQARDSRAMSSEENYWPIIVEQMRAGLL